MPGLDQTGPQGQGPRTGRQMGKCNSKKKDTGNNAASNDVASGRGKGRGKGKGLGMGRTGNGKGLGLANRFGQ